MEIAEEKKTTRTKTEQSLYNISELLFKIATELGELSQGLALRQYREYYLKEGSPADRKFVEDRIKKLQPLIKYLKDTRLILKPSENNNYTDMQNALTTAQASIKEIRTYMIEIWSMRNSGDSPKENTTIQKIINNLFVEIKTHLTTIQTFVNAYNSQNILRLKFKVIWTKIE